MNVRHSSATVEHFTPPWVVEAARDALGGIDLDPAGCEMSKAIVRSDALFTKESNGYASTWWGSVFLNPPGGKMDVDGAMLVKDLTKNKLAREDGAPVKKQLSSQKAWWQKLSMEWTRGRVRSAFYVGFTLEILQQTQVADNEWPLPLDFPLFFPSRRVNYFREEDGRLVEGDSPPHASVFAFLPEVARLDESVDAFSQAMKKTGKGKVVVPRSVDLLRLIKHLAAQSTS